MLIKQNLPAYNFIFKNLEKIDYFNCFTVKTFGIHATAHTGTPDTLGESLWFSDSLCPSNVQPSSCNPPILIEVRAPLMLPFHEQANFRLSIEHWISLLHIFIHIDYLVKSLLVKATLKSRMFKLANLKQFTT